jgi:hypothetical protein
MGMFRCRLGIRENDVTIRIAANDPSAIAHRKFGSTVWTGKDAQKLLRLGWGIASSGGHGEQFPGIIFAGSGKIEPNEQIATNVTRSSQASRGLAPIA